MNKTTIAVIGAGIVGERILRTLSGHPEAGAIVLFDTDADRLGELSRKYSVPAARSLEEVFELSPDWVYIGTPPRYHAPIAEAAFQAGLDVLCEKPLAHDEPTAARMAAAAEQSGRLTAMHFPILYSPTVRTLLADVAEGKLGSLMRVELQAQFPQWPRKWQQNPWIGTREQGGFIREVFPHFIQIMSRLSGGIEILSKRTDYPDDPALSETGVLAIGETRTGVPVQFGGLAGAASSERIELTVYGSEAAMKLVNWSELYRAEGDGPFEKTGPESPVPGLFDELIRLKNGEEAEIVTFSEGAAIQKVVDALL
ncbi:Gfo/Idh/MocA family protein [Edaphobacillus lindanitolerans]|uniref:Predicted dehydrogenase n=1 Tax=Edaphobacillus lindanitolerans TaxID=550447 RepID=A0A1U7PLV0_9BACI|nr:Gfo/Idh/MocA family oxidoreductase [Edaphobacillus lindanitolerans]SIT68538.1 Predicted dehydrogenase [Edaphobacillus lindanitolerans]